MVMQKIKYGFVVATAVLLSACNINHLNFAYCPAAVPPVSTKYTLKVGEVYDDRMNLGNLTNDPREIGEISWQKYLAPHIYYGAEPVANSVQTALHMSLTRANYKLTPVHPDRILLTRINEIKLNLEGKNNTTHMLYSRIDANFAVTNAENKILWRKQIIGEGSVDVGPEVYKEQVKQAFNRSMDDLVLQLERSPEFNRVLR